MVCYYCNWKLNIRGYDGIGRHARFRFSCFTACRFDPCYPHQKGTCSLASAFLRLTSVYQLTFIRGFFHRPDAMNTEHMAQLMNGAML